MTLNSDTQTEVWFGLCKTGYLSAFEFLMNFGPLPQASQAAVREGKDLTGPMKEDLVSKYHFQST